MHCYYEYEKSLLAKRSLDFRVAISKLHFLWNVHAKLCCTFVPNQGIGLFKITTQKIVVYKYTDLILLTLSYFKKDTMLVTGLIFKPWPTEKDQ